MHIFVINLEKRDDRREFMSKQLVGLGLDFEFVPAIDGSALSEQELSRLCDFKWMRRYEGRELARGEIGCSLSHLSVYQRMFEQDIPCALILEDDAWLTPSVVHILTALEKTMEIEKAQVYSLSSGDGCPCRVLVPPYHVKRSLNTLCTHAYVITKQAARRMHDALFPVAHVSDSWRWLTRHKIIDLYTVFPTLATQNNITFESDIWAGQRPIVKKSTRQLIRHKCYRAYWKCVDQIVPIGVRRKV